MPHTRRKQTFQNCLNLIGRGHLRDPVTDGKITLR